MPEIINFLHVHDDLSKDEPINKTYLSGNISVTPTRQNISINGSARDASLLLDFVNNTKSRVPTEIQRRFKTRFKSDSSGKVILVDSRGESETVDTADINFIASVESRD